MKTFKIFLAAAMTLALASCGSKEPTSDHEHSYGNCSTIVQPTCQSEGEEVCICAICGDKRTSPMEKIDHKYVDGKCTMCNAAKYGYMTVTANALSVRSQPTTSSERVAGVQKGKSIIVIEIEENGEDVDGCTRWVKTVIEGTSGKVYGWVSAKYLVEPVG